MRQPNIANEVAETPVSNGHISGSFAPPVLGQPVAPTPAKPSKDQVLKATKRELLNDERRRLKSKGLSDLEIAEHLMQADLELTERLSPLLEQRAAQRLATFRRKDSERESVIWVLMDSGAANHVCDVKHFELFKLHNDRPGREFVTATGEVVPNLGTKNTKVNTSEGSTCNITFQCAEEDMPVLSTRKLCEAGHEVLYTNNGGLVIDTKRGQTTRFIQRAGVYYLKLHVLRPAKHERAEGFGRQA